MKGLLCLFVGGHFWEYEPKLVNTFVGVHYVALVHRHYLRCTRCGARKEIGGE